MVVIESGARAGGNHIWSCFENDVTLADRRLIEPLVAHSWGGHEVHFSGFERGLPGGYASLSSERLDAALRAAMPAGDLLLGADISSLAPTRVTLADGRTLEAGGVIDARGSGRYERARSWLAEVRRTELAHRAAPWRRLSPIIMDATVDQADGYRFVYTLPFSASELFIEDTYYTTGPELAVDAIRPASPHYAGGARLTGTRPASASEKTGAAPGLHGRRFRALLGGRLARRRQGGAARRLLPARPAIRCPTRCGVALRIASLPHLSGAVLHEEMPRHGAKKRTGAARPIIACSRPCCSAPPSQPSAGASSRASIGSTPRSSALLCRPFEPVRQAARPCRAPAYSDRPRNSGPWPSTASLYCR